MLTMSTYHHGDLKNALKVCAITFIENNSIHALSLRQLAKLCGVSATSVYRHYKNKESLLAAIAEEGFNQLHKNMSTLEDINKIEVMCLSYIQFGLSHSIHFNLMFGSLIDKINHPSLVAAGNKLYELLVSEIQKYSNKAADDGENLSRMVWSTVHGITVLALDKQFDHHIEPSTTTKSITDEIVKTLMLCIRGLVSMGSETYVKQ